MDNTRAVGDYYDSISGVKMDLATLNNFLMRLSKDDLAFEQVAPQMWKVKVLGCEGCLVAALPISRDDLVLDFYLMEWEYDPNNGTNSTGTGTAASGRSNTWANIVIKRIQRGLVELRQAVEQPQPAQRGKSGKPGLTRSEIVERLVMVLKAEEIKHSDPQITQAELVREIGWTAGGTHGSKAKLFQDARQRLDRYRDSGDPDGILQEAQERFEKEKKET